MVTLYVSFFFLLVSRQVFEFPIKSTLLFLIYKFYGFLYFLVQNEEANLPNEIKVNFTFAI